MKVKKITVDLHDGVEEGIEVDIKFKDPIIVNFGTNAIIKTLLMGAGFQRSINSRKYGIRKFEIKVNQFLDLLGNFF
jgi:hypothetical protein